MRTVYLVDDSALVRERLMNRLSELCNTKVAGSTGNPVEALHSIRVLRPDVVVLDIDLPGKSGLELLKEIKRDRPEIRVVMLTNYDYPQLRRECLDAGAEYFLNKAKDFEQVTSIVEGAGQSPECSRAAQEGEAKTGVRNRARPP
jgi:DNA-binding NarL/FixJ family response regulator